MKSPLDRGGLRFYLVLIALLRGAATYATILAGTPCIVLGTLLHFWAKGCLRQNRVVAMAGPYRFVRHPFYLANALIDAGIAVMSGWWPLQVALPFWWLAIYLPVMRGEEKYLLETFAAVYADYRKRVPQIIPWRRPLPRSDEGFQWSNPNIADGEELPRAVRILAYPLLFLVLTDFRAQRFAMFGEGLPCFALSTLVLLYVLAWELVRHQRRKQRILPHFAETPLLRVVLSLAVLGIVFFLDAPETPIHNLLQAVGAGCLAISALVFARTPVRGLLAEALALIGAIAVGEWLWLSAIVVAIYAAWILDSQLPVGTASGNGSVTLFPPRLAWPFFYYLLLLAAVVLVAAKTNYLPAS